MDYADQVIKDPTWTKAMFVRNPHERLLSAFLDKQVQNYEWIRWSCCNYTRDCMLPGRDTFDDFIVDVLPNCSDVHWVPYAMRMESKYWKYINFVGHMEHMPDDGIALLKRIGAWDHYRALVSRSNPDTNTSAAAGLAAPSTRANSSNTARPDDPLFISYGKHHATGARERLKRFYANKTTYDRVSDYYKEDYNRPILNLSLAPHEAFMRQ